MHSKSPAAALESFIDTLGAMTKIEEKALPDPASAEDIYNRERAICEQLPRGAAGLVAAGVWVERAGEGIGRRLGRVRGVAASGCLAGWAGGSCGGRRETVTFRTKLFLIFTLALVVSVGLVAAAVDGSDAARV